jgi:cytochrome c553
MTAHLIRILFGCALAGTAGLAQADAQAGRTKAQACVVCHGQFGVGTLPNAPHLAGQPQPYLAEQLKAFRSGKRTNEVMSVIAKPLTDADITDLADWYASVAIEVKPPPN